MIRQCISVSCSRYPLKPSSLKAHSAPGRGSLTTSPVPGLEQHIWVLDGVVEVTVHVLHAGDCLRFQLWGASGFHCPGPDPVRYAVVAVP
jgi:hypothetical protein